MIVNIRSVLVLGSGRMGSGPARTSHGTGSGKMIISHHVPQSKKKVNSSFMFFLNLFHLIDRLCGSRVQATLASFLILSCTWSAHLRSGSSIQQGNLREVSRCMLFYMQHRHWSINSEKLKKNLDLGYVIHSWFSCSEMHIHGYLRHHWIHGCQP